MGKNLVLATVALMGFIPAGCEGPREHASGWDGTIDTLADGRTVVKNGLGGLWDGSTAWTVSEDLRIGTSAVDGPEAEQFGYIGSVASDSKGRIYVLDTHATEVRVFDSDGSFLHSFGTKGEGPGEFLFPSDLSIGFDDRLWVLDDGTSRYSVFEPDGTFVESHPRRVRGRSGLKGTVVEDGSYVDWGLEFPEGRFSSHAVYHPIVYSPGFRSTDSLPPVEHYWDMLPNGTAPLMYFGSSPVGAVDEKGSIWFANSREYRIFRRTLEGDTTLVFSRPSEAAPVEESHRDYVREQLSRAPDLLAGHLEGLPQTRPLLQLIVPDNAGHLFVFVDVAGEPEGTVVDVFRADGVFLGSVRMPVSVPLIPPRLVTAYAKLDYLFVVSKDEFDAPFLSRLKINKGKN